VVVIEFCWASMIEFRHFSAVHGSVAGEVSNLVCVERSSFPSEVYYGVVVDVALTHRLL